MSFELKLNFYEIKCCFYISLYVLSVRLWEFLNTSIKHEEKLALNRHYPLWALSQWVKAPSERACYDDQPVDLRLPAATSGYQINQLYGHL